MKKMILGLSVLLLISFFMLSGCSPKKAESSKEALDTAKGMETVDEKINYLEKQANAFYKAKEYKEAIQISQYIISELDKNSEAAKSMISDAKEQLEKEAKSSAEDMSNKLKNLGK